MDTLTPAVRPFGDRPRTRSTRTRRLALALGVLASLAWPRLADAACDATNPRAGKVDPMGELRFSGQG